jgi:DNA mismatch repair protein MLH1
VLTQILSAPVFVGVVDLTKCLSLIQHSTKLYLVNHASLAEELFYQLGLRQFGGYGRMRLEPAPELRALLTLAIEAEDTSKSKLSKTQIVEVSRLVCTLRPLRGYLTPRLQVIVDTLMARREMLAEYFSLSISEAGSIETLPLLLRGYTPNLDRLPLFLMRLGPQVHLLSFLS